MKLLLTLLICSFMFCVYGAILLQYRYRKPRDQRLRRLARYNPRFLL